MDSLDFFVKACKAERYKEVSWVMSIFTLTQHPHSDDVLDFKPYDIAINRSTNHREFLNPESGNFEPILGMAPLEPIIGYKKEYHLNPGDLPNVKEKIKTLGGNILANLICSISVLGDKLPYVNKKAKPSDFNSLVEAGLANGSITAAEHYRWCEAVSMLGGIWSISTPTGSPESIGVSKEVIAERDRLLKEHANELDNTVVVAEIEKRLVALDKASFDNSLSKDFFISDKSIAASRKKAFVIYGLDEGLGGTKPSILAKPLTDGIDYEYIPANADSTRSASYSRGFLTAQGGELVNYLYRIFMNAKITVDDCGTSDGVYVNITSGNIKKYTNRYVIDNKKTLLVDKEVAGKLIGKRMLVRTPARCKVEAPNFCASCTDKFFSLSRHSVHIETSLPGSIIMNDRMKAMHGRAFKIAMFSYTAHIS